MLIAWIEKTIQASAARSRPVSLSGFSRLPSYFTSKTLQSAKFVIVDRLPMPPLTQMGLTQFSAYENGNFAGITYLDTFYVRGALINEALFFHELIHVIQWRLLGAEKFLTAYAAGLEQFGYAESPLEAMAYEAQRMFETSSDIFDAENFVGTRLGVQ